MSPVIEYRPSESVTTMPIPSETGTPATPVPSQVMRPVTVDADAATEAVRAVKIVISVFLICFYADVIFC